MTRTLWTKENSSKPLMPESLSFTSPNNRSMKLKNPPNNVLDKIKETSAFVIGGHKSPDGDCISSQLALASFLESLGKEVFLLSAGPFAKKEVLAYEKLFKATVPSRFLSKKPQFVIIDCSEHSRTGLDDELLEKLGSPLIIDHHASASPDTELAYLDPSSPSSTLLIQKLIETERVPTREEADLLFFGFATDTGFFRFLKEDSGSILRQVSRLADAGAVPNDQYRHMTSGQSFESRKLMSRTLSRLEPFYGGRLLITTESIQDMKECGTDDHDSDSLYNLILSIDKCISCCIIREHDEESCRVGLRSVNDEVNVSRIASGFGGGGHIRASGMRFKGNLEQTKKALVEAYAPYFS